MSTLDDLTLIMAELLSSPRPLMSAPLSLPLSLPPGTRRLALPLPLPPPPSPLTGVASNTTVGAWSTPPPRPAGCVRLITLPPHCVLENNGTPDSLFRRLWVTTIYNEIFSGGLPFQAGRVCQWDSKTKQKRFNIESSMVFVENVWGVFVHYEKDQYQWQYMSISYIRYHIWIKLNVKEGWRMQRQVWSVIIKSIALNKNMRDNQTHRWRLEWYQTFYSIWTMHCKLVLFLNFNDYWNVSCC